MRVAYIYQLDTLFTNNLNTSINDDDAPLLNGLNYSVLALGDTSYELFCQAGKDIDARLEKLGANRIYERVDCDIDFEDNYEDWAQGVLEVLGT